jgi:hypothetical protein
MDIQEIVSRINENSRLLSEGRISEIERDILLEDLRSLYLLAKGSAPIHVKQVVVEQPKVVVPEIQPVTPVAEDVFVPIIPKPIIEQAPVIEYVPVLEPKPIIEEKPIIVHEPVVERKEAENKEHVQLTMQITPEPPVLEFAQKEEVKTKPAASINDVFAGEERSLNERLSGGDKRPALNDQAGRKDLKSMIDFNKQYVLTNELFKGDSQAFQSAITHINNATNIEAAFEYIKTELLPKYKWSGEMQSARLFDKLVRQKFGL